MEPLVIIWFPRRGKPYCYENIHSCQHIPFDANLYTLETLWEFLTPIITAVITLMIIWYRIVNKGNAIVTNIKTHVSIFWQRYLTHININTGNIVINYSKTVVTLWWVFDTTESPNETLFLRKYSLVSAHSLVYSMVIYIRLKLCGNFWHQ